jgi:hypothetical protein
LPCSYPLGVFLDLELVDRDGDIVLRHVGEAAGAADGVASRLFGFDKDVFNNSQYFVASLKTSYRAEYVSGPTPRVVKRSNPPPLNDSDNEHDESKDQKYVDESTHGVGGNQAQEPKNDKDDGDCLKHVCLRSRFGVFDFYAC